MIGRTYATHGAVMSRDLNTTQSVEAGLLTGREGVCAGKKGELGTRMDQVPERGKVA